MVFSIVLSALLLTCADAHGRLQVPKTRLHTRLGYDSYENDPANFGTNQPATVYPGFVCRNDPPVVEGSGNLMPPQTSVSAGGQMDVKWSLSANHVGDCAAYISYDFANTGAAGRSAMQWFKIANWRDCKSLDDQTHQITLPSWLPAGRAVFRWDWYALHVHPAIEFYTQCSDIQIAGSSQSLASPSDVPSYSILGVYPESANVAPSWRFPFTSPTPNWVTGPPCACRESQQNGCPFTASATASQGYIAKPTLTNVAGCGGTDVTPVAAPTQSPPSPVADPTPSPVAQPVAEPTNQPQPVAEPTPSPVAAPVQPPTSADGCAAAWAKCGGKEFTGAVWQDWTGPTCCVTGYACVAESEWYAQCVNAAPLVPNAAPIEAPASSPVASPTEPPSQPAAAPTEPPSQPSLTTCEAPWAKCAGFGYDGPGCCTEGHFCNFQTEWYSQCIPLQG